MRNVFLRRTNFFWFLKGFLKALTILGFIVLAGCETAPGGFEFKNLAKTDIDMVADAHRDNATQLIHTLLIKLYKRNPRELHKLPGMTIENRLDQFRRQSFDDASIAWLDDSWGIDTMRLAFQEDFRGDRVFVLMIGLTQMISESYSGQIEFFILDSLDQQKLYNSARNVEVLAWLLRTKFDSSGEPMILSNSYERGQINLSFERLLAKLIANQDMLAVLVADKTQRHINTVAHSVMSMTFIPL